MLICNYVITESIVDCCEILDNHTETVGDAIEVVGASNRSNSTFVTTINTTTTFPAQLTRAMVFSKLDANWELGGDYFIQTNYRLESLASPKCSRESELYLR